MTEKNEGQNLDRRNLLAGAMLAYASMGVAASPALAKDDAHSELSSFLYSSRLEAESANVSPEIQCLIVLRFNQQTPYSPATYVRCTAEPTHPGKLKTADGIWWELVDDHISLYTFGAAGQPADDARSIQNALDYLAAKGGGELEIPSGKFQFGQDIHILGSRITLRGTGARSLLIGLNNSRLIVGKAQLLPGGHKGGTRALNTLISNIHIAPDSNHAGECLLLDFADNTTISDTIVGPYSQDGKTVTHGIKTNWVQYTEFRNVSVNVNGNGIYILLPKSLRENEDHFSFYSCWLYCGKWRNDKYAPACIAVERQAGRSAAIFQLALYSCHLGSFMASKGDRHYAAGMRCISEDSVDARILHAAQFVNCMFEYVGTAIDLKSMSYGDTSRIVLMSCSFLQQDVCFLGRQNKSSVTSLANYFLQCKMIADGPRVSFVGANVQTSVGEVSAQPLSYHSFSEKYGASSSLSHVSMAKKGKAQVKPKTSHLTIVHELDGLPSAFRIAPSWKTTWWIESVDDRQFDVHFDPSPKKAETIYWDVEV